MKIEFFNLKRCSLILKNSLFSFYCTYKLTPSRHGSDGRASDWSHTVRQLHDRFYSQAPPMTAHRYVEENILVAMLAAKRCHTRGESQGMCNTHMLPPVQIRLPTLALKPRGDIIKRP